MASVSIVLPVKDGAKTISQSVLSIFAQTVGDFELLVLDNDCSDASIKIVESFRDHRIKVINAYGETLANTLNEGIRLSQGEICVRMDADDISHPSRLQRLIDAHQKNQDHLLIGSNCKYLVNSTVQPYISDMPQETPEIRWHCLFSSPFIHPCVSFKRKQFVQSEYFYPGGFPHCEDYALWASIVFNNLCSNLREPLLIYRIDDLVQKASVKRSLQLEGHEKVMQRIINDFIGISLDSNDIHQLRCHLVTNEGQKIDSISDQRAKERTKELLKAIYASHVSKEGYSERVRFIMNAMLNRLTRMST